jgi:hypothetical protein
MNRATTQFKSSVQAFCSVHRPISAKTVRELMRRGLLHLNGDRWRFGDKSNRGVTRSLSDLEWKHSHTSAPAWHGLIGLQDVVEHDRHEVIFVIEGSKDALAAAELARRAGALDTIGILCALGSGYRPIRAEVDKLRGRKVLVIGDNDAAGRDTVQIVSHALTDAGVEHSLWNWGNDKSKDLYEWLVRSSDSPASSASVAGMNSNPWGEALHTQFSPPFPPSQCSSVQVFKCSSQEIPQQEAGINDDERLGIVCPFIVTTKGAGNRMSFLLARSIRHRKFSITEIQQIFHLWFVNSRPLLPPDADEAKSLQTFYRQMRRVRFTNEGLKSACQRACKAKPPFIPARDGDETVAALAALCRELQRDAGDRPFICPVSVAQQFLGVKGRATAAWFLTVLEDEKVIECVDRGVPNKRGVKGKPTLWRYKLPL